MEEKGMPLFETGLQVDDASIKPKHKTFLNLRLCECLGRIPAKTTNPGYYSALEFCNSYIFILSHLTTFLFLVDPGASLRYGYL